MKFYENIRIAFNSLLANKLRAALTMLGIMIGVGAVITLLSIGDGVTRFIANQFIGLGANLVFILPEGEQEGPPGSDPLTESSLTMRDFETLSDPAALPGAVGLAPVIFMNRDLTYEGESYRTLVNGSTPNYSEIRGYIPERGRFFDANDYNGRARVAVVGQEVVNQLFPPDIDPLGADIKIRGLPFRIIGILGSKGAGAFGNNEDDLVIVPLTTAQERLSNKRSSRTGQPLVDLIIIQAVSDERIDDIIISASDILRQNHRISFRADDDFFVLTQQDFLDAFGQVTGVLTIFLGAIASISLLVGGIGIMNIMLVSVTERTREIGLRKAVGARRIDILSQFLTEAIILALAGGAIGILIGMTGAAAINWYAPSLDTSVTLDSILLAVGFSVAVGLFFGIYPAARAARLHPIEALRFE